MALCDEFCRCDVLIGETCRELCMAESKIEKSVCEVTNSVVKSPTEFSMLIESDLIEPSISATANMMAIRYLMNFLTPIVAPVFYALIGK